MSRYTTQLLRTSYTTQLLHDARDPGFLFLAGLAVAVLVGSSIVLSILLRQPTAAQVVTPARIVILATAVPTVLPTLPPQPTTTPVPTAAPTAEPAIVVPQEAPQLEPEWHPPLNCARCATGTSPGTAGAS